MSYASTGFLSAEAGPSRQSRTTGSWHPLPYIYSGFAIHPFSSGPRSASSQNTATPNGTSTGHRNRFSWSGVPSGQQRAGQPEGAGSRNIHEVSLDIGDEFFAFEEYRCSEEEDGKGDVWYRGFVVPPASLGELVPDSHSHSPSGYTAPRLDTKVNIGIFPAAFVHVRPGAINDDGTLAEAFAKAVRQAEENLSVQNASLPPPWARELEEVQEVDEEVEGYSVASPGGQSSHRGEIVDVVSSPKSATSRANGGGANNNKSRPKSFSLDPSRASHNQNTSKAQPPVPTITAGDSTVAGQIWPLVDEIACAIREWHERLPTYLANREYRLFDVVMQHIDCLYVGRRQILAQTHSEDELSQVRRECVSRLVKCNVAQGLDVIVRSLEDGSVLVIDRERAYSGTNWISGIAAYVYQVQLAYIDLIPLDTLFGKPSTLLAHTRHLGLSQPTKAFSLSSTKIRPDQALSPAGSFSHLLLDVRALLANPCAHGETAELFFSLFSSTENRFITEEFCLILNHLGSPARDMEQRLGRLRTLFTDLKPEDLQKTIFLVCRIVRNGAMKVRSDTLTVNGGELGRRGSHNRSSRGNMMVDYANNGRNSSIIDSATDDSFSVTSGYAPARSMTVDTSLTAAASIIDGRPSFRRPFGCAVLAIPPFRKLTKEADSESGLEFSMPIYVPREENGFATLHEDIIAGRNRNYQAYSKAESIAISLRMFQGTADQIVREHPSYMHDTARTARIGFPDVVYPGAVRNDLYIKLWSGSFVAGISGGGGGSIQMRKSVMSAPHDDVQITLDVRRSDGTLVQDALYAGGSGEPPLLQYHSMVFHHNERPTFGELIKISLDPTITDCHLFLTFRQRGRDRPQVGDPLDLEKPFAFAYLPLLSTTDSTKCVKDDLHELILYRMENNLQPAPNLYFEAPYSATLEGQVLSPALARSMTPLRDRISVKSYLCSNAMTTDNNLGILFNKPAALDPVQLSSALQMFNFVDEEEIAKFVPNVLDALFGIMVSNLGDRQDQVNILVFNALIKVLAMSSDRRFTNFTSVLDIYITSHFAYGASSSHLLRAMRTVMASPTTKEYRSFLKVWHLVFRFIIRARALVRARGVGLDATSAHIEADFIRQTRAILADINNLMKSSDKALIGTQTLAVQHYAEVLPNLSQVFAPPELAEIVIAFADTITTSKGSIAIYKLLLLLQVVKTSFDTVEARALLVPAMVRWVKPHLGRYEDVRVREAVESQSTRDARKVKWLECNRLATTVVACMINKLQEWHISPIMREDEKLRTREEENIEYCLSLLPYLVDSYAELAHPSTMAIIQRHRSTLPSVWKQTPDVFPMSHPFALIADLPPPSLLDRQHQADEAGLTPSETFNCGLSENATVTLSLIYVAPQANLLRWLLEVLDLEGVDACSFTLISIMQFAKSIISFKAFPQQWLTLSLMCHGAIVRFLDTASTIMIREEFIPPAEKSESFNTQLWKECFELLCDICGSDALALEEHSHQRRRAGWIIAGDLREDGVALLRRLWNAIGQRDHRSDGPRYGGYQTRFGSLAGRILTLCMSGHDETCRSAVEILFSMIYAEYLLNGKFDSIETEVLIKLDTLFSAKTSLSTEPAARAWFVSELRNVFEATPTIDEAFQAKVSRFLEEIELFIALLENVRELPQTPEWADERASATYQMLDFIRRLGRQELYIRFVHQLKDIFVGMGNWTGAGQSLKLHADLYEWKVDGDWVEGFERDGVKMPAQSQFARKEALYYHALDCYAEAQAYEHALELAQELVDQHQKITFDVGKLSELLAYQAKLWDQIAQTHRPRVEYYRVAFYGELKPAFNQGKEFVIRGRPWQLYSEFCDELQHKYPLATFHKSKTPPTPPVRSGTDQLIWVTPVSPEPDMSHPVFSENVDVDDNVRQWHKYNGIKTFSSTRPYKVHSPRRHSDQVEVIDNGERRGGLMTWLEKTVLITKEPLPGILNRSEVVEVSYQHLSPISVAIGEVATATRSLRQLSRGGISRQPDIKQLGTAINGAVDSPVSGGIKLYRNTFLSADYLAIYPDDAAEIDKLRLAILEYARVIQDALVVHGQGCKDTVFHEALKSHFMRSFRDEIPSLPRMSETIGDSRNHLAATPLYSPDPDSRRPSDVSQPSITITAPQAPSYTLPPLRVNPTPAPVYPSVPISTAPSLSSKSKSTTPIGSPTSSRIRSPTSPGTASIPTIGSRAMSLVGSVSNRSGLNSGLNSEAGGDGGGRRGSGDTGSASGATSLSSASASASIPSSGLLSDGNETISRKKGNRLSRLGSLMRKG